MQIKSRSLALIPAFALTLLASSVPVATADEHSGDGLSMQDFQEVSRSHQTVTIIDDEADRSYTGPGVVVNYVSRSQANCSIAYGAADPYIYVGPAGSHSVVGVSVVDVAAGCSSAIRWAPQLLIFEAPGGYVLRATGGEEVTFPGQQDSGYVERACLPTSTTHSWLHRIDNGAAGQTAPLTCSA